MKAPSAELGLIGGIVLSFPEGPLRLPPNSKALFQKVSSLSEMASFAIHPGIECV